MLEARGCCRVVLRRRVGIDEVVTPATSSTTTRADGIAVIDDTVARVAITISGLRYADAQRVLVIGRSDNGALHHVAAGLSVGR